MEAISLWAQVLSIDGEGAMAAGEGLKALAMRLLKELSISTGPTTTSPEARQPASPPEQTAVEPYPLEYPLRRREPGRVTWFA